ncbi:MAG: hypothetical protein HY695_24730 [Deltaproteobacteria bacterium]|nr:hypothetical protein [Deltaproteobacteria bacterium]
MQALILLAIVGLPLIILVDSKRRLGKYNWGWAIFALVILFGAMGQLGNQLRVSPNLGQRYSTADLVGTLIGAYAGGFALYRVMTRRKSAVHHSDLRNSQAGLESNEPPAPPPPQERTCLTCGEIYHPDDYLKEAAAWYCSICKGELLKE